MKIRFILQLLIFLLIPVMAYASEPSSSIGMLKIVFGLCIVLAVIALVAWLLKRMLPTLGGQQSIAKVLTSISVGTREKVVVIEVADQWIVVGVAPGQVTAIANFKAMTTPNIGLGINQEGDDFISSYAKPVDTSTFAQRLKQASHIWNTGAKADEINNANN